MVLIVDLTCISLRSYQVEHLFKCMFCHLNIFFGEVSVKLFGLFFNCFFFVVVVVPSLLSFMSSLYILDDSLLLGVSFTGIFSQSLPCLLLLAPFFAEQSGRVYF